MRGKSCRVNAAFQPAKGHRRLDLWHGKRKQYLNAHGKKNLLGGR
jgi:hypothetical protein